MFDPKQFSGLIHTTLNDLGLGLRSQAAVQLLLGTAAQESRFGTYLHQINGPALGVFQMEPETEMDIWYRFLAYRPAIENAVELTTGVSGPSCMHLRGNLIYQIAMARVHYFRVPHPLPDPGDIDGMAAYWKQHYNTPLGRGTTDEFVKNYRRYVGDFQEGDKQ